MGFRFRKKVKIAPGIDLNVTKKGLSSLSLGKKGAAINVGKDGRISNTIGLPGTGLHYKTDKATPPWLYAVIAIAIIVILLFGKELGLS
jgi:hypothetical protein